MTHSLSDHFPFGNAEPAWMAAAREIPGVDPAEAGAAISFGKAVVAALERLSGHFASFGLTPARWRLLVAVMFQAGPEGATISELARHLEVREPTVTGTVDRLVADELVARMRDRSDRRRVRVILTPTGKQLVFEVVPVIGRLLAEFTRRMGGAGELAALAARIEAAAGPGAA